MADAPRVKYPVRLGPEGLVVVEQDSGDDLLSTAFFAYRTPAGFRLDAPDFGVESPVFELPAHAMHLVVDGLEKSDPRLAVSSEVTQEDAITYITAQIEGTSA